MCLPDTSLSSQTQSPRSTQVALEGGTRDTPLRSGRSSRDSLVATWDTRYFLMLHGRTGQRNPAHTHASNSHPTIQHPIITHTVSCTRLLENTPCAVPPRGVVRALRTRARGEEVLVDHDRTWRGARGRAPRSPPGLLTPRRRLATAAATAAACAASRRSSAARPWT